MSHKIITCLYGFGLLLLMFVLESCSTGGSALPQTSLPLPENDPVTVSAPNYQGFVTVTGAESAVPESSIVVITVGAATSFNMDWNSISEFLLPKALATACSSDLPQCPDLSSDHQCQYTASADGSFTLTVPATLSSTISVGYLDPTSCAETSAYTETVTDTVVSVDLDVIDAQDDRTTQTLYLLGSNSSGDNVLLAYSLATGDSTEYSLSVGTLTGLGEVIASSGVYYLIVTYAEHTEILATATDGSVDTSFILTIVDSAGSPLSDLHFMTAEQNIYSATDACPSAELFTSSSTLYTRLIFYKAGSLYLLDFVDSPDIVEAAYQFSSDKVIARSIALNFGVYSSAIGSTVTSSNMISMQVFENSSEYTIAVVEFDTVSPNEYVLFREPHMVSDFCATSMDFSADDASEIRLGSSTGGVAVDVNYTQSSSNYSMNFLKRSEESFFSIDLSGEDLGCSQVTEYGFGSALDSTNECAGLSDLTTTLVSAAEVNVSNIAYGLVEDNNSGSSEIFLLGTSNGGSDFFVPDGSESQFDTGQIVNVIAPIELLYDATNTQFITIDAGVDGDGRSNLVFYDTIL